MKVYTVSNNYLTETIKVSPSKKNIIVKPNRPYLLCPVTIKNVGRRVFLIPLSTSQFVGDLQGKINPKCETKLVHPQTGRYLGMIRYFNMLIKPEDPAAIQEIHFDNLDTPYNRKLSLGIEAIENMKDHITSMAEFVYCNYRFMPMCDKIRTPLYEYCNNFMAQEVLAKNYKEPQARSLYFDKSLLAASEVVHSTYTRLTKKTLKMIDVQSSSSDKTLGAVGGASANASFAPTEPEALVDEISNTLADTSLAPTLAQDVQKVEEAPRRSRAAMRKHKAKAKKQANANKTQN